MSDAEDREEKFSEIMDRIDEIANELDDLMDELAEIKKKMIADMFDKSIAELFEAIKRAREE